MFTNRSECSCKELEQISSVREFHPIIKKCWVSNFKLAAVAITTRHFSCCLANTEPSQLDVA